MGKAMGATVGGAMGGDVRTIALFHATRILLVALVLVLGSEPSAAVGAGMVPIFSSATGPCDASAVPLQFWNPVSGSATGSSSQ